MGGNWTPHSEGAVSYNTKVMDDHLQSGFDVLRDWSCTHCSRRTISKRKRRDPRRTRTGGVDNPEYLVHETFFSKVSGSNTSYGRSILGTKA